MVFAVTVHGCHTCSIDFVLNQDPASHNLGTTVWDASLVLAKYIEKNLTKEKVSGKKAVELGAGVGGICGMALALLGADIKLTDITEPVLNLLQYNMNYNLTPATLRLRGHEVAAEGLSQVSVTVEEFDWRKEEQIEAARASGPVDYVVAADCVYNEEAVSYFLNAVLALCGSRTTCMVCNEFRSQSVHDEFMRKFAEYFVIRKATKTKMYKEFYHPMIHVYIMKQKK